MNSIKVCEYSRSRSFHDDLILQDQASGERSQDQWSSGVPILFQMCVLNMHCICCAKNFEIKICFNQTITYTCTMYLSEEVTA